MTETALNQLEKIGYWMAGAATAIPDWQSECSDMREFLHALVDSYLDDGGEMSAELTNKSFPQVFDDLCREASEKSETYPHAIAVQEGS